MTPWTHTLSHSHSHSLSLSLTRVRTMYTLPFVDHACYGFTCVVRASTSTVPALWRFSLIIPHSVMYTVGLMTSVLPRTLCLLIMYIPTFSMYIHTIHRCTPSSHRLRLLVCNLCLRHHSYNISPVHGIRIRGIHGTALSRTHHTPHAYSRVRHVFIVLYILCDYISTPRPTPHRLLPLTAYSRLFAHSTLPFF